MTNYTNDPSSYVMHETAHIWQFRIYGPLVITSLAGWAVVGGSLGAAAGAIDGSGVANGIYTGAYVDQPIEAWAFQYGGPAHYGQDENIQWYVKGR